MAYATLPKPGTELGPCVPDCTHTECALTRQQAASICHYCCEPIGYERAFCTIAVVPVRLVHVVCLQEALERMPF